ARISSYCERHPSAKYIENGNIWHIPCQLAFPCATQNEMDGDSAATLVKNGCIAVSEGANMPVTPEGIRVLLESGIAYGTCKAVNPGGVATSALEMQQNPSRDTWTFDFTEQCLKTNMQIIHENC